MQLIPRMLCLLSIAVGIVCSTFAAEPIDTGFESQQGRVVRKTVKAQEWLDMGQEIYDLGEKASTLTKTLQRIHDTDHRISEIRGLTAADLHTAQQREMQQLMTRLKEDVRSLGSGSVIASTFVDQLKAKLPLITERLRDIDVPVKADFSFLKQTAFEVVSTTPNEACAVVTRLMAGKQEINITIDELDKTIEALNGVHTRLSQAENLIDKMWSLLSVPVVNIPVYYAATDIYDLQEAIGPVRGEVNDKRKELERARDYDKKELASRTSDIDRTIALYQMKHKIDPCRAAAQQATKLPDSKQIQKPPTGGSTFRTIPTLADSCLTYTITSKTQSYVSVHIENTCERVSIKVEHACTGIGLKPVCSTCDTWHASAKRTDTKTCHPGP